MAKRRVKKTLKQPVSSPPSKIDGAGPEEPPCVKKEDAFRDPELERQCAAIRAMRDVEIDHLLTGLRLLRSYIKKEQLQTPVLQFFRENLPNLSIVETGRMGQYEVEWKDRQFNLSVNKDSERNIHASLLRQMSIAYPDCSAAIPPLAGFEFSTKPVKAGLFGADNLQIKDFVLDESSDTQMLGVHDALQTPGATSQRLSVGVTPKTLRLPKHGEMLLSVHGSPLGVYKEDNMEAIHESEEGCSG